MEREYQNQQEHKSEHKESPIEGASVQPPQFKTTAKLLEATESPYSTQKDNNDRFAFGGSNAAFDESNKT